MTLPRHTSDFRSGRVFSAWWQAGEGLARRGVATTGRTVILRAQKALNVIFMSTVAGQAITLIATQEGALALDATIGERTLRRLEVAARFFADQNLVSGEVASAVASSARDRRINDVTLRFLIWIGMHHSFDGGGVAGSTSAVFDVPFAAVSLPSGTVFPQVGVAPARDVPSGQVRVWNPATDQAPTQGPVAGGSGNSLTVSPEGTPRLSNRTNEAPPEEPSWLERNGMYLAVGAGVLALGAAAWMMSGKKGARRRRIGAAPKRKQLGAGARSRAARARKAPKRSRKAARRRGRR